MAPHADRDNNLAPTDVVSPNTSDAQLFITMGRKCYKCPRGSWRTE